MSESVETIPGLVPTTLVPAHQAFRVTTREWLLHGSLFILTVITTTLAGIVLAAPEQTISEPPLNGLSGYALYVPRYYARTIASLIDSAVTNPHVLGEGVIFSVALLAILTAHEMGHYVACRRYGVSATLPFFIPAPPLFLTGTFGAFIKIRSAIPTRRALFDIGLAGPLAGFVVAIPVTIIGILHVGPPAPISGSEIIFNDPLLFKIVAKVLGVRLDPYSQINPYYMAAWIGLLVTSLNLMPVGQLDGGHGTYAVFGQKAHKVIGRLAFGSMVVISVLGFVWHGSPSGFLYSVLLAIMLKVRHPQPEQSESLGTPRILIAVLTLLVFVLCFWPFPLTIH